MTTLRKLKINYALHLMHTNIIEAGKLPKRSLCAWDIQTHILYELYLLKVAAQSNYNYKLPKNAEEYINFLS